MQPSRFRNSVDRGLIQFDEVNTVSDSGISGISLRGTVLPITTLIHPRHATILPAPFMVEDSAKNPAKALCENGLNSNEKETPVAYPLWRQTQG